MSGKSFYLARAPLIPGDINTTVLQGTPLVLSGSVSGTVVISASATSTSYDLTLPNAQGAANTFLGNNGTGVLSWSIPAGAGDVVGPASATDTALAIYSGTTGKIIQNSVVTLSSLGVVAGVRTLTLTDSTTNTISITPATTTTTYVLTLPSAQGAANTYLQNNGSGTLTWVTDTGYVTGPASATDTALALYSGTTGKIIQNSTVTVSSVGAVAGVASMALKGTTNSVTISPAAATVAYPLTLPAAQGAANSFLSNNGAGALSWLVATSVAPVKGLKYITASGVYTPTAGTTRAFVYCTGGGGGGGGCTTAPNNSSGSGGNGGGTYCGLFAIDDTKVGTVTIGGGGLGSTATTGATGGASTFLFPSTGTPSATITGPGGFGGIGKTVSNDNSVTLPNISYSTPSGTAINAVLLGGFPVVGQMGSPGIMIVADSGCSGAGGSSMFGIGSYGVVINNNNPFTQVNGINCAANTGGGGSGGIRTGSTLAQGGNGGSGVIIIMEY